MKFAASFLLVALFALPGLAQPTQPAPVTPQDLFAELAKIRSEIRTVIPNGQVMRDKAKRDAVAAQATPLIRRMADIFAQLGDMEPDRLHAARGARYGQLSDLVVLGDAAAKAELTKVASGDDKADALIASSQLLSAEWTLAGSDAPAQGKVLDQVADLVKANPESSDLAETLSEWALDKSTAPEVAKRAGDLLTGQMKGDEISQAVEMYNSRVEQRKMVDKPLVLAGAQPDGGNFSTDQWKGKVVLVDFWATWCGPCLAELPRVKKAYADYHDKGLEILGVSSDQKPASLDNFLKANPDMPWPQLFDAKKPGWHALTKQYKIMAIPTMYLIDKKGVLRSVDAREDFEEQIPKLLAE